MLNAHLLLLNPTEIGMHVSYSFLSACGVTLLRNVVDNFSYNQPPSYLESESLLVSQMYKVALVVTKG